MIPAIQTNYLPSYRPGLFSKIRNKAADAYESVKKHLTGPSKWIASGMTAAALGVDIATGASVFSLQSATFATAALSLAYLSLRPCAARIISRKRLELEAMQVGNGAYVENHNVHNAENSAPIYPNGQTVLHYAVRKGRTAFAKILIANGEDPYAEDINEFSPLLIAIRANNLQMIRILTQTENIKAFDSCKTAHDFFDLLFPPSKDKLPPNWEAVIQKIPPSPAFDEFNRRYETVVGMTPPPSLDDICDFLSSIRVSTYNTAGFEIISQVLADNNPAFALAWNLANKPDPVNFETASDNDVCDQDGYRMFSDGDYAAYKPESHKIEISQSGAYRQVVSGLVFETMNSLQRTSLLHVHQLHRDGETSREDSSLQSEFIEIRSYNGRKKIFPELGSVSDLSNVWIKINQSKEGHVSHTDEVRFVWDRSTSSSRYLRKHPRFLQQRLQELAAMPAPHLDFKEQGLK